MRFPAAVHKTARLGAYAHETAAQSGWFSLASEYRLQTGQTFSDAYGPISSFDPTADAASFGRGPVSMYQRGRTVYIGDALSTPATEELIARANALIESLSTESSSAGFESGGQRARSRETFLAAEAQATSNLYASGAADTRVTSVANSHTPAVDSFFSLDAPTWALPALSQPLHMSYKAAQVAIESAARAVAEVPLMTFDLAQVSVNVEDTPVPA